MDAHQHSTLSGNQRLQLSLSARVIPSGFGDLGPRVPFGNFVGGVAIEFGVPAKRWRELSKVIT